MYGFSGGRDTSAAAARISSTVYSGLSILSSATEKVSLCKPMFEIKFAKLTNVRTFQIFGGQAKTTVSPLVTCLKIFF